MKQITVGCKSRLCNQLRHRYVCLLSWLSLHLNVSSFGTILPIYKSCSTARIKNAHEAFSVSVSGSAHTLLSSSTARRNDLDFQDFQEGEYGRDGDDGLCTFQEYKHRLEALSRVSSMDVTAAPKAEELFSQMFETFCEDGNDELRPTTEIYNLVMNCWAFSRSRKATTQTEKILERMENASDEFVEEVGALPDIESYMAVMDAYINQKQPTKAVATFQRLQDRYAATNFDESLRPNTSSYNRIIKAWRNSERVDAAARAEQVLREMLELYEKDGNECVKPNTKTFAQLIVTLAQSKESNSCKKAQQLYDQMIALYASGDHEDLKPDTLVLNALMKAYALSKLRNKGSKAQKILTAMIKEWKNGNTDVAPDQYTFINMFKALANPKEKNVATKVGVVLDTMEELSALDSTSSLATPSIKVYNDALNALAWSRDHRKVRSAFDLLERLARSKDGDDDEGARTTTTVLPEPDLRTYNMVMQTCAFTNPEFASREEKMEACKVALQIFNRMRDTSKDRTSMKSTPTPDNVTYGLFFKVCGRLMPEDDDDSASKKERVIEYLFRQCCADGLVSDFVLLEFVEAASSELQEKLLGESALTSDSVEVPMRWSRNVD